MSSRLDWAKQDRIRALKERTLSQGGSEYEVALDRRSIHRAQIDHFAEVNGCEPQSAPEPAEGSGVHICTSYEGCMPGYPVRWCAFDEGHTPSPRDQGESESWVPQEVWDFFTAY